MDSTKPSQRLEVHFSTGLRMILEIPVYYKPLSEELVTSLVYGLAQTTGNYSKKPILISHNPQLGIIPGWLYCSARLISRGGSLWTTTMQLHWKFRIQSRTYQKPLASYQMPLIVN